MTSFFPRHTVTWKIEEPPAFRRLSLSLIEMAAITGVLLRLYRALALTHAPADSWAYLGGTFAIGAVFLLGMATLHLGNYPLRHWTWRAPAFAAVEAIAESATSLLLIALHREPVGTARATFSDWPRLALDMLFWRLIVLVLFAVVLAGVVQLVRRVLLRRDHREHTVTAVHDEIVRQAEAKEG
jgi:hypothetical protein